MTVITENPKDDNSSVKVALRSVILIFCFFALFLACRYSRYHIIFAGKSILPTLLCLMHRASLSIRLKQLNIIRILRIFSLPPSTALTAISANFKCLGFMYFE